MEQVKTEIKHLQDSLKNQGKRIEKLEEKSNKDIERLSGIEHSLKYLVERVDELGHDLKSIKAREDEGIKKWAWIVITAVTTSAISIFVTLLSVK